MRMDVVVRSHHVEVTPSLRAMARRKLGRLERVARDLTRAEVDFADQRNPRIADHARCSVILHLRDGRVTARAAGSAPEVALDLVVDKLRHQIERHKDRRVSRAHDARRSGRRGRAQP
jgi:ribosomal subunit interface protein